MKKKIILRNEKIEYTVRKHKMARQVKMSIYCGGDFVITVPWRMNLKNVERFIKENAEWVLEKLRVMRRTREESRFVRDNPREYMRLREAARSFVHNRLPKLNKKYGFEYNRIYIRNQKTRWGSCSANGDLSFNYKILLLPKKIADYIIVHELCHLKEFNHSPHFWNLVKKSVPDYEKILEKLRNI